MSGSFAEKSERTDNLTGGTDIVAANVNGTANRTGSYPKNTLAFYNNLDVEVVVTFQGSNEHAFTRAWSLPETLTISASGNYDYTTLTEKWTYVRPVYNPTGSASSGTVECYWIRGE